MSIIIKAKYVLTDTELLEDFGIKIIDNKIACIAKNEEFLECNESDCIVIDATNKLLAPGFVNGHMHMYGVLSHGITTESLVTEFSSFLEDFWWPYVENRIDHDLASLTTKWSCAEMIKSGITSFTDILEAPNAIPLALEQEAEVVKKSGLRAFLSFEACERISKENGELGLLENAEFIRKYNNTDSIVKGIMCIHTLFTCQKDFVIKAKNLAKELNCDIHMHLSESVFEPDWCLKNYGKRPVEIYNELNFLDEKVFASQVVQMEDFELDILASKGVRAVSMPLSNCEVGGGVAPVSKMIERGILVGLGTDGYINNFFEVMRGAFLIHKAYLQNPQAMPAKTVYNMATSIGAKAMGISNAGAIKEGFLADVITIDLDTPTPINKYNVYDQIILFRNPENVNDVIVDGKVIMRNKKLLTLDEMQIKEELYNKTSKFWTGE